MVIFNGAKKCKIRLFSKECTLFGVYLAKIRNIFNYGVCFLKV